jgi:hypothetical protein
MLAYTHAIKCHSPVVSVRFLFMCYAPAQLVAAAIVAAARNNHCNINQYGGLGFPEHVSKYVLVAVAAAATTVFQ